jgi:hypothetical protein
MCNRHQLKTSCHPMSTGAWLWFIICRYTNLDATVGDMLKYQWWPFWSLVCTICYPCSVYTSNSEYSSWHQGVMEYFWSCKSVARYHEHRTLNSDVWQWRATAVITSLCGLLVERYVDLLLRGVAGNILRNIWLPYRHTRGPPHYFSEVWTFRSYLWRAYFW